MLEFILSMRGMRRGQTMTEYALILAAVAIVCIAGYELMGNDITSLLSAVDEAL